MALVSLDFLFHLGPAARDFIAGAVAGAFAITVSQPLDTVRVRLQQHRPSDGLPPSTLQVLRTMLRKEGMLSPWKGLTYPLLFASVQSAILFQVYGWTLRNLAGDINELPDPHQPTPSALHSDPAPVASASWIVHRDRLGSGADASISGALAPAAAAAAAAAAIAGPSAVLLVRERHVHMPQSHHQWLATGSTLGSGTLSSVAHATIQQSQQQQQHRQEHHQPLGQQIQHAAPVADGCSSNSSNSSSSSSTSQEGPTQGVVSQLAAVVLGGPTGHTECEASGLIIPRPLQGGAAGAVAGFAQVFLWSPVEYLKLKLQLQTAFPGAANYLNPLAMAHSVVRQQGVAGLYRGFTLTAVRDIPSYGLYFFLYHRLCHALSPGLHPEHAPPATQLLAGGLSGVLAWLPIYPLDVIKTRMQAAGPGQGAGGARPGPRPAHGWLHYARELAHEGGARAFMRGASPTLVRAFVMDGCSFLGYTATLRVLPA